MSSLRMNGVDVNASSFDVGADKIPASELTRPSPDAILADEADPDTLLGIESDSEAGGSRPVSALFDAAGGGGGGSSKRKSKRISKQMQQISLGPSSTNTKNEATPKNSSLIGPEDPSGDAIKSIEAAANKSDSNEQVTELTTQVTTLNNKLVKSFVRIGDLEDDLSDMQETITNYKKQIEALEKERQEHLAALNTGLLVEKEHVSSEMQKMMERLVQETAEKGKAVNERQKIESELDELSSSLFSEANKMVAVERLARARAEEKSRSMEERLKDTEEIVGQQQKRLVELQAQVERNEQRDSSDTPHMQDSFDENQNESYHSTGLLGKPVAKQDHALLLPSHGGFLRLDIVPYVELRSFLNHLRRLRLQLAPFYTFPINDPASTKDENSQSTPIASRTGSPAPHQFGPSSSSSSNPFQPSPFLAAGIARHRDFPTLPANVEQLIYLPNQISSLTFLKRFNDEDCEPCLGLDHAPGLNWLSKRQMRTAILDGTFMIEPIFGGGIYDEEDVRMKAVGAPPAACAMCGRAVVNVPLPGGGNSSDASGWMNAATSLQASVNAMANSLPVRDLTASPPPQGTGRGNDQAKELTKNRSSIFSTLRNISGGKSNVTQERQTNTNLITDSALSQSQSIGVIEDQFAARPPPIPTHIFRISEASSARYLICPDYCLKRIRATCDFWGYVRNLERAVVLEGKFAWDDEVNAEEEAAPRLPTKDPVLAKGGLVEDGPQTAEEPKEDAEGNKTAEEEAKVEDATIPSEEGKNTQDDSDKTEESSNNNDNNVQGSRKVSTSHTASDVEDDHDFADAKSQHSSEEEDRSPITDKGSTVDNKETDAEEKETGDTSMSVDASDEGKDNKNPVSEVLEVPVEDETPVPSPLPKSAGPTSDAPSLPKTARPVPRAPDSTISFSTANTPPALPPRRARTPAAPVSGDVIPVDLGPEPRKLLSVKNAEKPIWEEKVWLEVNRLRADMWSARIGVQADE